MFLMDTNIVSELRKPRPHGAVVAWARAYAPGYYSIPCMAVYELQVGVELVRKQDAAKSNEIDRWIEQIVASHSVVPVEQRAAREAARIMRGQPREMFEDAMIAAIAKVNGLTVATRKTKDFEHFGVSLVNPLPLPTRLIPYGFWGDANGIAISEERMCRSRCGNGSSMPAAVKRLKRSK